MVKFNFENLSVREMLEYVDKLHKDIKNNDRDLQFCKDYVYGIDSEKFDDESEEQYRIRNIKQFYQDKLISINLLTYSRKKKQLTKKLRDLEMYLINKGVIKLKPLEEFIPTDILLSDESDEEVEEEL